MSDATATTETTTETTTELTVEQAAKPWYMSSTIIVNVAVFLILIGDYLTTQAWMSPDALRWIGVVSTVITIGLRLFVTQQPVTFRAARTTSQASDPSIADRLAAMPARKDGK